MISHRLYLALLESPGDESMMRVLSDALDEADCWELAHAYRWAAENHRWPFSRLEWKSRNAPGASREAPIRVYDWDGAHRSHVGSLVPESARLSREIYEAMVKLNGRTYGGVNTAFSLLANVLAGNATYVDYNPWPDPGEVKVCK